LDQSLTSNVGYPGRKRLLSGTEPQREDWSNE
jgi:hypothetical protein